MAMFGTHVPMKALLPAAAAGDGVTGIDVPHAAENVYPIAISC